MHLTRTTARSTWPILVALGVGACESPPTDVEDPSVPTAVFIQGGEVTFSSLGQTVQRSVVVSDQRGRRIEGASVQWISSNPDAVGVSSNGLMTAVANGDAYLIASVNAIRDSVVATVLQVAETVEIVAPTLILGGPGSSVELAVDVVDEGGSPLAQPVTATWSSSEPSVAVVSDATVTGVAPGSAIITALVGQTSDSVVIEVTEALILGSVDPPTGVVDQPYSHSFDAIGGRPPFVWAVVDGDLPTGLALEGDRGSITGTPSEAATATVTLEVSSSDAQVAQRVYALSVFDELTVSTSSLDDALEGSAYSYVLTATGGDGAYEWTAESALPAGLSLTDDGTLTGAPATFGLQDLVVSVTSGDGQTATESLSLSITEQLRLSQSALPDATLNTEYEAMLGATGGVPPYSWTLTGGVPPTGLNFDEAGADVSGTPTVLGTSDLTFEVRSQDGQSAQAVLSLAVRPPILAPDELCSDNPDYAMPTLQDSALEAVVRSALGVGPEEDYSCAAVTALRRVDGGGRQISSLLGIQNLTGLEELLLYDNQLTDISPLGGLSLLEELWLGINQLTDISPLAGLTAINWLDLALNQIEDLTPLASLTNLGSLSLLENDVRDVSALSSLVLLDRLVLDGNDVADISPLSGMTGLQTLRLQGNPIVDFSPLSGLTRLESLEIRQAGTTDLAPLTGLTNLTHLIVDRSGVSDLSFLSGMTDLVFLRMSQNAITDISPLSGLTSLTRLEMDRNAISDVTPIAGMSDLVDLYLQDNQVADLTSFSALTSLRRLRLWDNVVTNLAGLAPLPFLEDVQLRGNTPLVDIQPLIDNTSLRVGGTVNVRDTSVPCTAVAALGALGVSVTADCS